MHNKLHKSLRNDKLNLHFPSLWWKCRYSIFLSRCSLCDTQERYRNRSIERRITSIPSILCTYITTAIESRTGKTLQFDSPWNLSSALISCFRTNYKYRWWIQQRLYFCVHCKQFYGQSTLQKVTQQLSSRGSGIGSWVERSDWLRRGVLSKAEIPCIMEVSVSSSHSGNDRAHQSTIHTNPQMMMIMTMIRTTRWNEQVKPRNRDYIRFYFSLPPLHRITATHVQVVCSKWAFRSCG